MRVSSKIVLRVAAIGVAAAAIGLPITAAQAAGPATGTVTATPNTGLTNTQSITVAGTGFGVSEGFAVVQCSAPADPASCDETTDIVTGATDNTGAFSTSFPVETGAVGNGSCVGGSTCFIEAESFASDPTAPDTVGGTSITFALAPTVTATPNTDLSNGDSVAVAGSGFGDSENALIVECSAPADEASCDIGDPVAATTDDGGSFTASFPVKTGAIGNGTCAAGGTCYIEAESYASDPTAPDATAGTPITFKGTGSGPVVTVKPSTGLKNKDVVKVSGSGFPQHNMTLFILECNSNLLKSGSKGGPAACDTGHLVTSHKTSSTGTFSNAKFTVRTGAIGNGSCGGSSPACYIGASTSLSGAKADSGAAKITFAGGTVKTTTAAKASAKKVKTGKKFTISGTVKAAGKGVSGLKETLYDRASSKKSWKKILTTSSKSGGKYKFSSGKLKGPKKSEQYQVKTLKQSKGGKTYGASSSKVLTVKAK